MTQDKEKAGLGWKMKAGIVASISYSVIAISILIMNLIYSPPSPLLGLNGIGDYLAGVFSPLAFFWLVIGYKMQENQIRENRIISNKQFNYLITKEQNDVQPIFHSEIIHEKNNILTQLIITIKIQGESIFDVSVDNTATEDNETIIIIKSETEILSEQNTFLFDMIIFQSAIDNLKNKINDTKVEFFIENDIDQSNDSFDPIINLIPIPIKTIYLNYMDRLGVKHKNKCTLYYLSGNYTLSLGHSIKPQEFF